MAEWTNQGGATDVEIVASNNTRTSDGGTETITSTSYTKVKEILFNEIGGTIRVYHNSWAPDTYTRVYVNGIAVGAEHGPSVADEYTVYTDDITVAQGDYVQLYQKRTPTGGTGANAFNLQYDKQIAYIDNTVT